MCDSQDIERDISNYKYLWGNPHFGTMRSGIAEQPSPLPKIPYLLLLNHSPPGVERSGVTAPILQNWVGSWTHSPAHTAKSQILLSLSPHPLGAHEKD